MNKKNFKSGFVAVIGRPNVGKSTFINKVLDEKVSIISPKPQTTRDQIRGVYTTDDVQIIFIDTPGIHKARHELGSIMNRQALQTLKDVDLVLYVIDGIKDFNRGDEYIISELKKIETPVFLIINKIDLIKKKHRLLGNIVKFKENFDFQEYLYISSLTGENIDLVIEKIKENLETGPKYYPAEQITDQPEKFVLAEIIREKVLHLTREEVPHSVAVIIEQLVIDENNENLINVHGLIYVERPSQKKIIIGNNGQMIKEIGSQARLEILNILGKKVFLELWVKVEPNWRNKINKLRELGYNL